MYSVTYNTRVFHFGVLLFGLLAVPAFGQPAKQKWMDSTEKSTIEAEFVRLADAAVVLKKDGKEITVPFTKLSLGSHLQALKLAKPEAYAKPAPKVIIGLQQTPESAKLLENPFPAKATVEQFMDTLIAQLDAKNSMVLWHALTPEMQTDVEDVIVSAVDAGGSGLLVQVRSLMKHLATLVNEKEQFILESPLAAGNRQLRQQLAGLPTFVNALADKQNWDAENFKSGNVAAWLAGMSVKLGTAGNSLLAEPLSNLSPGASLRDTKKALAYKVLSQTEDKAQIELLNLNALVADPQTGQMKPSKETRKIELVRVSDKWLPKEMVDDWSTGMSEVKLNLALVMPMARTGLAAVIPIVSSLSNAKTQQEFNLALQQVTRPNNGQPGMGGPGMMPGMMGGSGMMGGPGGKSDMGGMGPGGMGMSAPGSDSSGQSSQ